MIRRLFAERDLDSPWPEPPVRDLVLLWWVSEASPPRPEPPERELALLWRVLEAADLSIFVDFLKSFLSIRVQIEVRRPACFGAEGRRTNGFYLIYISQESKHSLTTTLFWLDV